MLWFKKDRIKLILFFSFFAIIILLQVYQIILNTRNKDLILKSISLENELMSLNKSYSGKIESLNETNAAVYRIEKKLDFISTSSSEMIIDKRLDFELIETIVNHFKAYEEENWELFIETINSLDEQWKEDYEDYSGGKYIIRKIAPVDHVIEPFFVEVIMDKDSDPFGFHLSVSRVDGKWKINMYD